jgi:hypothetical protein
MKFKETERILTKKIEVPKKEADFYERLLHEEPKSWDDCFGEDETVSLTAKFEDGNEIDVKICGVQYDEDATTNKPWTEAVLFDSNGSEILCSDVEEELFGTWILEHDGTRYVVDVVAEGKEAV